MTAFFIDGYSLPSKRGIFSSLNNNTIWKSVTYACEGSDNRWPVGTAPMPKPAYS
jgi:hypothetical protein